MTTTINHSYSAIVPAVYGTATPVIDVGHGPGSVDAVVAFTRAGSVVVNLGNAPPGAVTYTVGSLTHEMSSSSVAAAEPVESAVRKPIGVSATASSQSFDQDVDAQDSVPAPVIMGSDASDGVYDGSGIFTPTMVFAANPVQLPGNAAAGADSGNAVGSLVSTVA
jgi:hypothetical protein